MNVEILEGEMERSMKQGKSLQKMRNILGVSRDQQRTWYTQPQNKGVCRVVVIEKCFINDHGNEKLW